MLPNVLATWRRWLAARSPAEEWTLEHPAIAAWRSRGECLRALTDRNLADAAAALKHRLARKEIDSLAGQIEAGALASEAVRRAMQMELFDTQRLAGLVLGQGLIAQMQTGEGKTLTGAAPIVYAALLGRGVHVMMPNAYLAERDADILRPALTLLGISGGLLREKDNDMARQIAYRCDVTYGAGYEFGFDYLKDQLALLKDSGRLGAEFTMPLRRAAPVQRQRGLAWAVIDEADAILLDEATVPLLLSGPPPAGKKIDERPYLAAQRLAEAMQPGIDFELNAKHGRLQLTEAGLAHIAPALAMLNRAQLERPWREYVEKALTANHLFHRDVHYVISGNKAVIVDESTGPLHADRSWRDGLHQAVEIKERLPLTPRGKTDGQITRQRFLRQYETLCGMTGTAQGSERELKESYGLGVVTIPTRLPPKRKLLPDRYFAHREAKWRAAVAEIAAMQKTGRPILVGSRTISASEAIAARLHEAGVECQVLNGRQTVDEAELVAQAGHQGKVTVATNMAGRGTDIRLGPGVRELGGLHLVGLERNTSPRVDAQLAGRVARQGDPGSCQFFVSADDAMLTRFAPRIAREMASAPHREGELIGDFSTYVASAQRGAEAVAALQRQRLREQDTAQGETIGRLYGVT